MHNFIHVFLRPICNASDPSTFLRNDVRPIQGMLCLQTKVWIAHKVGRLPALVDTVEHVGRLFAWSAPGSNPRQCNLLLLSPTVSVSDRSLVVHVLYVDLTPLHLPPLSFAKRMTISTQVSQAPAPSRLILKDSDCQCVGGKFPTQHNHIQWRRPDDPGRVQMADETE